jgi:hypothetical protein
MRLLTGISNIIMLYPALLSKRQLYRHLEIFVFLFVNFKKYEL